MSCPGRHHAGFERLRDRRGATLLEVMVALGILATAYVALMETQSGSIRLSTYGKQITVATFLAQTKLEETEEKLFKEGFPDMDEEESEDFEDLGYPSFKWKLEINKVELPLGAAFDQLLTSFGQGDDNGEGGMAGMLEKFGGGGGGMGQLAGMLKGGQGGLGNLTAGGGASGLGGLGGGAASLINPDMLRGNVDMLTDMLEQAIREVRLTVSWDGGGEGNELVITTHLVRVPQASAAAGAGAMPAGMGQPGMDPNQLKQLTPGVFNKTGGGPGPGGPSKSPTK